MINQLIKRHFLQPLNYLIAILIANIFIVLSMVYKARKEKETIN